MPETGYIRVKFQGGGVVPKELQGAFTSERFADLAIERYRKRRDEAVEVKEARYQKRKEDLFAKAQNQG